MPRKLVTEGQLNQWATDNGLSAEDAQARLLDQNTAVINRPTLNRWLHGITGDHDILHDIASKTYGVDSISKMSDEQMLDLVDKLSAEQAAPAAAGIAKAPAAAGPDVAAQLQQSIDALKAKPGEGSIVKTRTGKRVIITKMNPDGIFDYTPAPTVPQK